MLQYMEKTGLCVRCSSYNVLISGNPKLSSLFDQMFFPFELFLSVMLKFE